MSPCGEGQRGPRHSDGQEVSGHATHGKAFTLKGVFTPVVSHPCPVMASGLPCLALPPEPPTSDPVLGSWAWGHS